MCVWIGSQLFIFFHFGLSPYWHWLAYRRGPFFLGSLFTSKYSSGKWIGWKRLECPSMSSPRPRASCHTEKICYFSSKGRPFFPLSLCVFKLDNIGGLLKKQYCRHWYSSRPASVPLFFFGRPIHWIVGIYIYWQQLLAILQLAWNDLLYSVFVCYCYIIFFCLSKSFLDCCFFLSGRWGEKSREKCVCFPVLH